MHSFVHKNKFIEKQVPVGIMWASRPRPAQNEYTPPEMLLQYLQIAEQTPFFCKQNPLPYK